MNKIIVKNYMVAIVDLLSDKDDFDLLLKAGCDLIVSESITESIKVVVDGAPLLQFGEFIDVSIDNDKLLLTAGSKVQIIYYTPFAHLYGFLFDADKIKIESIERLLFTIFNRKYIEYRELKRMLYSFWRKYVHDQYIKKL